MASSSVAKTIDHTNLDSPDELLQNPDLSTMCLNDSFSGEHTENPGSSQQQENQPEKMVPAKSFSDSMVELKKCSWYWGAISPTAAARLLQGRPTGTFLVRDSRSDKSIFSISYTTPEGVFHSRIYRFQGRYCLGGPRALIRSESLVEFVETMCSQGGGADGAQNPQLRILMHPSLADPTSFQWTATNIDIKHPLGRNQFLPSLKYFCRLTIRETIRDTSLIATLPVPRRIKKFLNASDYLLIC